jgi:transcriptional antiterminator NusG
MNDNTHTEAQTYGWFALRSALHKEEAVKQEILETFSRDEVKEILIPTLHTLNLTKPVKKYMPGYMILHMADDPLLFRKLKKLKNVRSFLGDPTPLTPSEVGNMINIINNTEPQKIFTQLQAGTSVIVKEGPFKDFQGVIASTNLEKANCIVDVYILGRSTPVELSFSQIEQET